MTEIPTVSPSTVRNRELAARRKRGAVMVTMTLEPEHLQRLVTRKLLDRRRADDCAAVVAALLALISAEDSAPLGIATGIPRASELEPPAAARPFGAPPGWKRQEFPKYLAAIGKTVETPEEEAAALAQIATMPASAPEPQPPTPSDWDKTAAAFEAQQREARERREAKELADASFVLRK